jgi:hypothetical protein
MFCCALRPNPSLKRSANDRPPVPGRALASCRRRPLSSNVRPQMTPPVDHEQRYRDVFSNALAGFQLIEEALKDYIGFYHETVRKLLPSELTYGSTRQDIQDAALGKLINVFAKCSNNQVLISELRSLISVRDQLAHRGLIDLYGTEKTRVDFADRAKQLQETAEKISGLLDQVNKESLKVILLSK